MGLLDSIIGQGDNTPSATPAPAAPLDQQYVDAIKGFEGYSPTAKWDYKQSSSGYGTKAQPGDENIPPDQLKQVHEQRLQTELAGAAKAVDAINPNLPAGPRAALISLTYNAGPGWANSGLGDLVRSGDLQGAQNKLLEYNKAGGKVNDGLSARRQQEASWFGSPQTAQASPASPAMGLLQTAARSPGLPLQIAPSGPPIFPPVAPQPQRQAQAEPAQSYWQQFPAEQMPTGQPPPIFYAPRKTNVAMARSAPGFFFRGKA